MANTYTSLHYHLVFSTKNRELWIRREVEQRVWAYLGGIAKQNTVGQSRRNASQSPVGQECPTYRGHEMGILPRP